MSWRKYGSIKNQETNNNITTNNIVAENLLFRNPNSSITFQTDLTITGNAHVNKLHFLIGMGVYTLDRYGLNGPVYHKLSLRYKPLANLLLGIGIKSHWLNADYLDVSVGFAF